MENSVKKIKQILDDIGPRIQEVLVELNKIEEKSIDSSLDRRDLFVFEMACNDIVRCKEYIGLTEAERIIKSSIIAKPMSAKVKKALGFDGCFE